MNEMTDDKILELFGSVPYFTDSIIEPVQQELAKQPFRCRSSWSHQGSVNIMRICGTMHPDYAGMTWRQLLAQGRRMDSNLKAFQNNPSYYTDIVKRVPGMQLGIVDGKGYVLEDGNHRTCIGKFYLYTHDSPFMHGVALSEQQTDMRMMSLYKHLLHRLPGYCKAIPLSKEIKRDDGDGWASHFYEISIRVENNRRRGYDAVFTGDELEEGLIPALSSPFRRFGAFRKLLF